MKSPFKFLDSYTKDDRAIFFGRDREIEELYQKVFDSKLLLVYGVSGTGKSSLIHCGLANKFRETDWLPLVIRRGGNIIESLAAAVRSASLTRQQNKFSSPADFKKGVRSLYLDHYKPVFFIFDQFEELFIFGDKEERRSFISIVKSLTESDLQCRMIFVMREEYMAGITEFEKFIPTIFSNRVRIEKMSHRNALEAIKEPCKVFNISLEEGFAEALLEKLSPGETDVELTYLQVFLDKIFRLAVQDKPPLGGVGGSASPGGELKGGSVNFTLSLLSLTGNVSDLLGSFLDDQIALMEDPDTAMSVLKAFVSGKGTKRPASESEAIDYIRSFGKEISPEKVKELIQSFVKLRVLRDKDENERYELRHDALAEKVYEKFSTAEKELLEIRQFIENSYQSYVKREVLLNNDDLEYISNKDTLLNLSIELKGFMEESRKQRTKKIKTIRRLTMVSALVFILMLVILVYYVIERGKPNDANTIAIRSLSQTKNISERFRLASLAWKTHEGALQKEAMLQIFNETLNSPDRDSLLPGISGLSNLQFEPAPEDIIFAACSPDSNYIIAYGKSQIMIWKMNGHFEKSIVPDHIPLINIKTSDNSRYIGAVSCDSVLSVWNIDGNKVFSVKVRYNILNTDQIFKFTKEGNILALSGEHDAVLIDIEGRELQSFDHHTGRVNAVDISPDNNFIATASCDKTVNVWYYNSAKKRYDFYNTLTWHKDTVWSAGFSKFNVTVITASNDSTIRVGTINNEESYEFRDFPNDKKYCFAEFSRVNRGIMAVRYEYHEENLKKSYVASHVDNPTYRQDGFVRNGEFLHGLDGIEFEYFVFSPDDTYFIYNQNNKTYLSDIRFSVDKQSISNLIELKGSRQFFTSDEKYIIAIEGNMLRTYFVDIEDIFNYAINNSIR